MRRLLQRTDPIMHYRDSCFVTTQQLLLVAQTCTEAQSGREVPKEVGFEELEGEEGELRGWGGARRVRYVRAALGQS